MATISSAGIGSGLDINGIITKLMAVEQQPLVALQKKATDYQAKLSAYGLAQSSLSGLQGAASALTSAALFSAKSASVSDSTVLSATASSTAVAGTHTIGVRQLAQAQVLRSNTAYAATTDTFHTGTLSISVGGATATTVTINSGNNTLSGIRDAIDAANAGVSATIVNDGTTNRLILTSKTTGLTAGAISITVSDSGSGGTHALSALASASLTEVKAPLDADFSVDGLDIKRSSNTVTDVIKGVTLTLTKAGSLASPVTAQLTVSRDTASIQTAIGSFVTAYNAAVKQLKGSSAYDVENQTASVLTGDSTVRSLLTQLSSLAHASVSGLSGGISRLSDIGITVQKDGSLATDTSKLAAALNDTNKDVAQLFNSTAAGNNGIAVRFKEAMISDLGTGGLLASRTDGINRSIKDLSKRQEALQLRLTTIEATYRKQFNALDTLVSSMNQTSTYLTQQLANLPSNTK